MDSIRRDFEWKVNNFNSVSVSELENLNKEIERKENEVSYLLPNKQSS